MLKNFFWFLTPKPHKYVFCGSGVNFIPLKLWPNAQRQVIVADFVDGIDQCSGT